MNAIFWSSGPNVDPQDIKPTIIYRYIGPYKVADWIRQHGYTAQVIDFVVFFTEEELWNATTKFITDETVVLGISTTFLSQYPQKTYMGRQRLPEHVLKVMSRIREHYPKIKFVLGGVFAEAIGTWNVLDAGVIGKSEDIFLELIEHYIKGSEPPKHVVKFPHWGKGNVAHYFEANNKKYDIEKDTFRFHESDCIIPGETLPLEISRGCIFKCKFCQYENLGRAKLDYLRATNCIEDEIRYNYEKFNVTNYHILCDTFNDTEYKVNEWYTMTQRLPFKINFTAYLRADLLHRFQDTCYQLKESGLMGAYHGIETFTPGPAKLIGKGWSGKHAKEWIPTLYHDIWNKEVAQSLAMIVGLPDDDSKNVDAGFKWFLDNDLHDISYNGLNIYKDPWKNSAGLAFSEFEKNAEKYGFTFTGLKEWHNGMWNWETADRYSSHMNQRAKEHRRYNNWSSLGLLSFGFDKEYILRTKEKDWDKSLIKQRLNEFINRYKIKLNSLSSG